MKIEFNKELIVNNLVIRKGKFEQDEFLDVVTKIMKEHEEVSSSEDIIITTTHAIEDVNGKQILDVEAMIPIKQKLEPILPYEFKSILKITNALYTKVSDYTKLQEVIESMNQYMIENQLQPITSAYLVQTKQNQQVLIEVYIGLNPNFL